MSSDSQSSTNPPDPDMPLPLEIVDGEVAAAAFFPDGQASPTTPLGSAFLFWASLLDLAEEPQALEDLHVLSSNPDDWGDYTQVAADLSEMSLMQNIVPSPDRPDLIAYAKFMPDTGHSMRAFDDAVMPSGKWLVLVTDGEFWFVWGVSDMPYRPSTKRILTGED